MRAKMVNEEYSEHDQNLIDQAMKTSYLDHYLVDQMAENAESEEAKEELEGIARYYYHKEEGQDI